MFNAIIFLALLDSVSIGHGMGFLPDHLQLCIRQMSNPELLVLVDPFLALLDSVSRGHGMGFLSEVRPCHNYL